MSPRRRMPRWISREIIEGIHTIQLEQFGGLVGIRDVGLLDSALARPVNRWEYDEKADLAVAAAAYAIGIAKNHPFLDGNKRTAFVAALSFLQLNGVTVVAPEPESVAIMIGVASGEATEEIFAAWIRDHAKRTRGTSR